MNQNIYEEWLKAATDDLKTIEKILEDKNLTHIVAFHSEQAIEKSLKAILIYNKQEVPKIHSLIRLFGLCEKYLEFDLQDYQELIIKLDELYLDSRYPADFGLLPYGKPSQKDAFSFYEFAKKIFELARKSTS
ncbi:MAG: HEPN domain-containing protein [Brevinematales bacterium]|nr:HEPN domain-containing protein [Brevinematales bacterium]